MCQKLEKIYDLLQLKRMSHQQYYIFIFLFIPKVYFLWHYRLHQDSLLIKTYNFLPNILHKHGMSREYYILLLILLKFLIWSRNLTLTFKFSCF